MIEQVTDRAVDTDDVTTETHPASPTEPRQVQISIAAMSANPDEQSMALLSKSESEDFQSRWTNIQTGFVDDPHLAVEQADTLVADLMKRLTQVFSDERMQLEEKWKPEDDISTEDLRTALRSYRSFFGRLVSI